MENCAAKYKRRERITGIIFDLILTMVWFAGLHYYWIHAIMGLLFIVILFPIPFYWNDPEDYYDPKEKNERIDLGIE